MADELLRVGRVWRPHGVHGECKVIPETAPAEQLADLQVIYLGTSATEAAPYRVTSVRMQYAKKGPLALYTLEGITDRDEAELLRGRGVFATASELPEEDEAPAEEVTGFDVFNEEGERLGVVSEVVSRPGQELFIIALEDGGEAMIPAVEALVPEIDFDAGTITITPIEGLLE